MKDAQENSLQSQQEYFTGYIQCHPDWVLPGGRARKNKALIVIALSLDWRDHHVYDHKASRRKVMAVQPAGRVINQRSGSVSRTTFLIKDFAALLRFGLRYFEYSYDSFRFSCFQLSILFRGVQLLFALFFVCAAHFLIRSR